MYYDGSWLFTAPPGVDDSLRSFAHFYAVTDHPPLKLETRRENGGRKRESTNKVATCAMIAV